MTNSEQLLLNDEGLPILTEIVRDDETPEPEDFRLATRIAVMDPEEIASQLLGTDVFQNRIEEVAASLSRSVCGQLKQTLKPALEEAISRTLNDSDPVSTNSVRDELEAALPGLVAEALQEKDDAPG